MLRVFDNVLSPTACRYLHAASSLGELGDEHHTAFDRDQAGSPQTALEACVHSILTQLRDESPCVEYWWRDAWEHVEAHEDVDEYLFEQTRERRYPTHGHVLYLDVGPAVRAPTCVWSHRQEEEEEAASRQEEEGTSLLRPDFGALTTVPARAGRLLRFDGPLMHAVPRPTLRWLPTDARTAGGGGGSGGGGRTGRRGGGGGGGAPPSPKDLVRSVVLFNTWESRPLDVPNSDGKRDPADVIAEIASSISSPKIDALVEAMAHPQPTCEPFDTWQPVEPTLMGGVSSGSRGAGGIDGGAAPAPAMKVWLLGEAERRGQPEKTLELTAPTGLADALQQEAAVTRFAPH